MGFTFPRFPPSFLFTPPLSKHSWQSFGKSSKAMVLHKSGLSGPVSTMKSGEARSSTFTIFLIGPFLLACPWSLSYSLPWSCGCIVYLSPVTYVNIYVNKISKWSFDCISYRSPVTKMIDYMQHFSKMSCENVNYYENKISKSSYECIVSRSPVTLQAQLWSFSPPLPC
jgi:hypothetical protein